MRGSNEKATFPNGQYNTELVCGLGMKYSGVVVVVVVVISLVEIAALAVFPIDGSSRIPIAVVAAVATVVDMAVRKIDRRC